MKQDNGNHAATPGPWYAWLPLGADEGCREIRTEEGRTHGGYHGTTVAHTVGLNDDGIDKANASRLAAAPELLEALERVRQACLFSEDDGQIGVTADPHIDERLFNEICAAIAKAKGD